MAVDHYENFPVASLLLPKHLRQPIALIYHFARTADDIADEGEQTDAQRLQGLQQLAALIDHVPAMSQNDFSEVAFALQYFTQDYLLQLARLIETHPLPAELFHHLLAAFSQDVVKKRYGSYDELLDYSRRSANPVGRLLLALVGIDQPNALAASDAICSALQFINFWQDVAIDWQKGRIYIPAEDLQHFGITEADFSLLQQGTATEQLRQNWQALMLFQCRRSRQLMHSGVHLPRILPGRLAVEIALTIAGGLRILDKIEAVQGDVWQHRPLLKTWDWPLLAWQAFRRHY